MTNLKKGFISSNDFVRFLCPPPAGCFYSEFLRTEEFPNILKKLVGIVENKELIDNSHSTDITYGVSLAYFRSRGYWKFICGLICISCRYSSHIHYPAKIKLCSMHNFSNNFLYPHKSMQYILSIGKRALPPFPLAGQILQHATADCFRELILVFLIAQQISLFTIT